MSQPKKDHSLSFCPSLTQFCGYKPVIVVRTADAGSVAMVFECPMAYNAVPHGTPNSEV